jgi:ribonuclease P protein component
MLNSLIRNTFRKPEKICNQKQIDTLFASGKSFAAGQFRLIYIQTDKKAKPFIQVLIAVSKKNIRHAVNRNRMKRLIREAYRVSKHKLTDKVESTSKHYDIAIVFTGKQCVSQSETLSAINVLLDRLIQVHEKNID